MAGTHDALQMLSCGFLVLPDPAGCSVGESAKTSPLRQAAMALLSICRFLLVMEPF